MAQNMIASSLKLVLEPILSHILCNIPSAWESELCNRNATLAQRDLNYLNEQIRTVLGKIDGLVSGWLKIRSCYGYAESIGVQFNNECNKLIGQHKGAMNKFPPQVFRHASF